MYARPQAEIILKDEAKPSSPSSQLIAFVNPTTQKFTSKKLKKLFNKSGWILEFSQVKSIAFIFKPFAKKSEVSNIWPASLMKGESVFTSSRRPSKRNPETPKIKENFCIIEFNGKYIGLLGINLLNRK